MGAKIKNFYLGIIGTGDYVSHFLLLAMRLYWGYAFFQAGFGKFDNIDKVAGFFGSLSIPLPLISAYLVACIETAGGLMLMFGLASRLAAIPLIVVMVTALLTAHSEATFNMIQNPVKFLDQQPFNFLLTSLIVFCFGPGKISIDYLFKRFAFKQR